MSQPSHLNLDDFPHSPYADELRRGVSDRPFANAVEAEYVKEHLDRVRKRVRVWYSLNALISALFVVDQLRSTGFASLDSLAHLVLFAPTILLMPVLVWTAYYERYFVPTARLVVPITVAAVAAFVASGAQSGEDLASLVLHVVALFFFSGLMFRTALGSTLAMLVAFMAAAFAYRLPSEVTVNGFIWLVITAAIAAIVCRDVEKTYRKNFLEGVLIRDLVARDGLTGVANRRAFDEHLRRVWQQGLRDRRSLALAMIDIDHFKAYNDQHGHQAGDEALRTVAQAIQNFARRPLDLAARYGGEEFSVILYDLSQAQLGLIAEQLRAAVEKLDIAKGADGGNRVTISIGIGVVEPALNRTPQGAVQFADEALYEAKQRGRNRVVMRGGEEYGALRTGAFGRAAL